MIAGSWGRPVAPKGGNFFGRVKEVGGGRRRRLKTDIMLFRLELWYLGFKNMK
jgi:hypothetical protein